MVAAQSSKRAAVAEEPGREKKLKLAAVTEAIERSEELPQAVKNMLVAAAPGSLGIPADERHEYQTELVTVIGEELRQMKEKLEQEREIAKSAVAEVENMKAGLDAAADSAKAQAMETEQEKKTKKYALAEVMQSVIDKKTARQEAEAAHQKEVRTLERLNKEKSQLEAAVEQHLKPLLDGTAEEGAAAVQYKALEPFLLKLQVEESLAMALDTVLIKKPNERGDFDCMVIEGLQKALDEKKTTLASNLEASSTAASQHAAAMGKEETVFKTAQDMLKTSANEYTSAETVSKAAEMSKKNANAEVRGQRDRLFEAQVVQQQKEDSLEKFVSRNMSSFEGLRDEAAMAAPCGA